ncbi:Dynein regulatory complex subunit 2 [Allomyces arbusculus]|nr:Dynein regulatory complex subunit 2 [Allomyces arbusculus]
MAKKKKSAGVAKTEADMLKTDEQRRKYAEMQLARRKDAFAREERAAKLNALKIQSQWRDIMKKAKSEALIHQLEVLRQVHDRHVDRKHYDIQQLAATLHETDDQYDTAYMAHLQNLDNLLDLQYNRLDALQRNFESELKDLELEFGSERALLQSQHMHEKNNLLGVIYRLDADFADTEADARHEYQSSRDDVKNKNLEEKHALRIQLESTIEDLWKQFQIALANYNLATDERKKQFEELKAKDEQSAALIETQLRKLGKLSELIASLKQKIAANAREAEAAIAALRTSKERVVNDFQTLKRKMNGYRDDEKRKLIELTRLASVSTKRLEQRVGMAEKIIKLAEMNSKLETEQEKLVWAMARDAVAQPGSHPAAVADPDAVADLSEYLTDLQMSNAQVVDANALGDAPNAIHAALEEKAVLTKFQKRYNKVLLDKLALEARRETLARENEALRAVLKAYLDGISVQQNIMDEVNPLVVVNGKTNVLLPKRTSKVITVVEGSQAYKNSTRILQ